MSRILCEGGSALRASRRRGSDCTQIQWLELKAIGKSFRARGFAKHREPINAFNDHKKRAARRGIEWKLTRWEWWCIWRDSGKFEERGRGRDRYVMSRKGDLGPYAVGNVFIDLNQNNTSNSPSKKYDLPMGVTFRAGKYRAQRREKGKRRYIGEFKTVELAHAAYLNAAGAK